MRGFIGNTDYDWHRFLASQPGIDEVNFWQPSASASFRALPTWLAWESFGPRNGAADFDEMRARIERYRRRNGAPTSQRPGDYSIGCIMVASPVFFPEELWVREPKGWAPNIVRGRGRALAAGARGGAHNAVRVRRHAPGHQRAAAQNIGCQGGAVWCHADWRCAG